MAQSTIGGLHVGSDWLTPYPSPNSTALFPPYPPPSSVSLRRELSRTHSSNWVEHLETLHSQSAHTSLKPQNRNLNITRHLWDPVEKVKVRQVTPGVISTWWGQTRVMKRMIERGDETALVLEDDVDFEWDLERLWAGIERKLPIVEGKKGWDITYLGHCWGGENQSESPNSFPVVPQSSELNQSRCRTTIPSPTPTSFDRSNVFTRLRPLPLWRKSNLFTPLVPLARLHFRSRPSPPHSDAFQPNKLILDRASFSDSKERWT